jgi:hypothetical protein
MVLRSLAEAEVFSFLYVVINRNVWNTAERVSRKLRYDVVSLILH